MLADSRDDGGNVFWRRAPIAQELEGHEGARMGVVYAVDTVPQVVHITGDAHEFYRVGIIAELLQNFAGRHSHFGRMLL